MLTKSGHSRLSPTSVVAYEFEPWTRAEVHAKAFEYVPVATPAEVPVKAYEAKRAK